MTSFLVFVLMILIFGNVVLATVSACTFLAWTRLSGCAHRTGICCSIAFGLCGALFTWLLLIQGVPIQAIAAILLVTAVLGFFFGRDEAKQKISDNRKARISPCIFLSGGVADTAGIDGVEGVGGVGG